MVPIIHNDHPFLQLKVGISCWQIRCPEGFKGYWLWMETFKSLGSIACEPFRDKLWLQHVTTRKEKNAFYHPKVKMICIYIYNHIIIYIVICKQNMCSCDPKRPDMNPEVFPNNLSVSRGIFSRNHVGVSENRLCPQRAILIYEKWWIIPKNFGRYPPINWHRCGKPTMKWSCSKQKTIGLHILYP